MGGCKIVDMRHSSQRSCCLAACFPEKVASVGRWVGRGVWGVGALAVVRAASEGTRPASTTLLARIWPNDGSHDPVTTHDSRLTNHESRPVSGGSTVRKGGLHQ